MDSMGGSTSFLEPLTSLSSRSAGGKPDIVGFHAGAKSYMARHEGVWPLRFLLKTLRLSAGLVEIT